MKYIAGKSVKIQRQAMEEKITTAEDKDRFFVFVFGAYCTALSRATEEKSIGDNDNYFNCSSALLHCSSTGQE